MSERAIIVRPKRFLARPQSPASACPERHRLGGQMMWEAFEAPGLQPIYPVREHAIGYARQRHCRVEVRDAEAKVVEEYPADDGIRFL